MTEAEKKNLIESYIQAYNDFDIDKMLSTLHDEIRFQNVSDGETTLELDGIEAFEIQARQVAELFSERQQKVTKFIDGEETCEINIDYSATLAADLPNGLKAGDKINLTGRSVFRFAKGKIIEIRDIS